MFFSSALKTTVFLGICLLSDYCWSQKSTRYNGEINSKHDTSSFILVGDTQQTRLWEFWSEKNKGVQKAVLQKVASQNPAFIIHLGDLVFRGASRKHWEKFDGFAKEIRVRNIPIWPVLGNHEYYGDNKRALDNFFTRFPHLNHGKWTAFRYKSIGIILLDSNFNDLEQAEKEKQAEWYRNALTEFQDHNDQVKIILVACHHSPYTNSKIVTDNKDVQQTFVEPFYNTSKAKLFFSGHCHSYERFKKKNKLFVVSGGGGGPRHKLRTNAPHNDLYIKQKGELRDFNFCKITILNNGVRTEMVRMTKNFQWSVGETFHVAF